MNERLTFGEFSRFCGVTVKTLRYYERMKLLVPSETDEWTHYRFYTISQMQQLNALLRLKEIGFSIEEVRELQDEGTNQPSMKQLEGKITQTENLLDALHERLALLKRIADMRSKIEAMDKISIQHLPEMVVASHRHMLRGREEFLAVCASVMGPEVQRLRCRRSMPLNWFVVEHDKEVKKENIDIEIFEEVEDLMPDTPILKFRVLPEVQTAVCMKCRGTFEHLPQQYKELQDYMKEHGFEASGPRRIKLVEYLWNQNDPEKWFSIIQVPVTRDKRPRLTRKLLFRS